jgi:hypothetical protein
MQARLRELAFLGIFACVCLALALAFNEAIVAGIFGTLAAVAAIHAARLSLRILP